MIAGGKYLSSSACMYLDIMPSQLEMCIHASVLSQLLLVCLRNPFCWTDYFYGYFSNLYWMDLGFLLSRDSIIFNIMDDFVNNRL